MRLPPASLRLKLTLGYALVFILASVLGAILIYLVASSTLTHSLDVTLEETAAVALGNIAHEDGALRFTSSRSVRQDLALELLNAQGQVTARAGERAPMPAGLPSPGFQTVQDWRVYTVPLPEGGWLRVMRPTDLLNGLLETLAKVLILAALLMIGLSCLGGYLLADRALKPVDQVARAAASIARRGAYRERVPVAPGGDELSRLSLTVNAMLDRLEGTIEHEKSFARMAAHELRTPLTTLAGRVELLLDRPRDAAAYRAGLVQLQERIEALRALSEGLLSLARTDAPPLREPVELAGAVLGVAEDLRSEFRAAGKILHLDVEEAWVQAEPEGIRQAAINLLQNALKYGGPQVTLRVRPGELAVIDNGCGPPRDDWPRLLHPLERGPGVQGISGSGLGLAVVAALARRWGAELRPGWSEAGFTVTLQFPAGNE
ncbi:MULTISPECIES: sensor histidine kinase [Deinococcus]|uniref:histidine kinase n=1 Tax=Deinococcus geothermalis (strain DSM 11300 / CIP 105573 / AG-3a) TaxID=319795 RepID=Q1J2V1_DEIGD|nr:MULTISPECIES: HAMP domain-containing sensor histidine kinase [Deinococcus]ABF44183.1 periplasmic sensor signal transduction histidine kinase [Deinococcus geothermalis DSM 11300]TDE85210.1 HAMP domain-containing histidine kinase [Deinococcus sp. S9]